MDIFFTLVSLTFMATYHFVTMLPDAIKSSENLYTSNEGNFAILFLC